MYISQTAYSNTWFLAKSDSVENIIRRQIGVNYPYFVQIPQELRVNDCSYIVQRFIMLPSIINMKVILLFEKSILPVLLPFCCICHFY